MIKARMYLLLVLAICCSFAVLGVISVVALEHNLRGFYVWLLDVWSVVKWICGIAVSMLFTEKALRIYRDVRSKVIRPSMFNRHAQSLIHNNRVYRLDTEVSEEDDLLRTRYVLNDMYNQIRRNQLAGQEELLQIGPPTCFDPKDMHIPTFRESLNAGIIGPGQRQLLVCHELIEDDTQRGMYTHLEPHLDILQNNATIFVGGSSKSGKTTYMANIAAQGALMGAAYYIIDPHLIHPDKSVAQKLAALKHAFILPPASTPKEIFNVLHHARHEAECRRDGIETPLSGRIIVFIVDEVLAVLQQAHRTDNKEVIKMYGELAMFLRDLGTQYNKFNFNGIFASQYVTKDAFKLPAPLGNIDFRDGCQNQVLMRLPPNQAGAMRLIDAEHLREARKLPQGHGWMGLYTGELLRMASGYVSREDIEYVASLAAAAPSSGRVWPGAGTGTGSTVPEPSPVQGSAQAGPRVESIIEEDEDTDPAIRAQPCVHVPVQVCTDDAGPVPASGSASMQKRFTEEQEIQFLNLYERTRSIKRSITEMHVSYGAYQACASQLVKERYM